MKAIEVRAEWLPEGEVAEIEKTPRGYDVTLPKSGITPRTAHALTAALAYVTGKMWRWDIRNPKVAAIVGTGVLAAFAVGWVMAPPEMRYRVLHMLPSNQPAEAAVAPAPVDSPAGSESAAPSKWVPPVSTRRPAVRQTETVKRKALADKPRPTPSAPVADPEPPSTVDLDPTTPPSTLPSTPAEEPGNNDNGNGNGGRNGNDTGNGRDDTLIETKQMPVTVVSLTVSGWL